VQYVLRLSAESKIQPAIQIASSSCSIVQLFNCSIVQKVSRDDVEIRHGDKLFAVVKRRNLGSHSCRFSALVSSATGRPVLQHQAHLHDASACPLPEWRGMKQNVCERRFYNVTCMFFLMDGLR
jgi:hypothetical protein